MPNGRILRAARSDARGLVGEVQTQPSMEPRPASAALPTRAIRSGGPRRRVQPPRNWLALDVVYQYGASTRITSRMPATPEYPVETGSSYALIFAPAIEYNFSSAVGVIFGVRIIEIGRNVSTSVTPAVAVNMVF
jgi:hypothetical protein